MALLSVFFFALPPLYGKKHCSRAMRIGLKKQLCICIFLLEGSYSEVSFVHSGHSVFSPKLKNIYRKQWKRGQAQRCFRFIRKKKIYVLREHMCQVGFTLDLHTRCCRSLCFCPPKPYRHAFISLPATFIHPPCLFFCVCQHNPPRQFCSWADPSKQSSPGCLSSLFFFIYICMYFFFFFLCKVTSGKWLSPIRNSGTDFLEEELFSVLAH